MSAEQFPPRSVADVDGYDFAEVVAGYCEWKPDDPTPGDNRSAGYRWGWMNGTRDRARDDDGFDALRHQIAKAEIARRRAAA